MKAMDSLGSEFGWMGSPPKQLGENGCSPVLVRSGEACCSLTYHFSEENVKALIKSKKEFLNPSLDSCVSHM